MIVYQPTLLSVLPQEDGEDGGGGCGGGGGEEEGEGGADGLHPPHPQDIHHI